MPTLLREAVAEWFELDADSPYMLLMAGVVGKHRISSEIEIDELLSDATENQQE